MDRDVTELRMNTATWTKWGSGLLLIAGLWWGVRALGIDLTQVTPERVRGFVLSFGVWAPVIYLLIFAQPLIPLPASIMTAAGGVAFGPWWGTLAAVCGATVRACTQFLIARFVGRGTISKLVKGRVAAINETVGEHGFKVVLLIRLIPNLPFDVQNYTLGVSRVRFAPYATASFLGIAPWSFVYVFFGYSLTDLERFWKLAVVILIIAALLVGQRQFVKRKKASL